MIMEAIFSNHAFDRAESRLSMSHDECAVLLDNDLCVDIGMEPLNNNRLHRLFYSVNDKQCFVAVQDQRDGLIVTIWPMDYHSNMAWEVSIECQLEAKYMLLAKPAPP